MIPQSIKARIVDKGDTFFVENNAIALSDEVNNKLFFVVKTNIIEVELLKDFGNGKKLQWTTTDGKAFQANADQVGSAENIDGSVVWFTDDGTETGIPDITKAVLWVGDRLKNTSTIL